jgi:hypothetical protein
MLGCTVATTLFVPVESSVLKSVVTTALNSIAHNVVQCGQKNIVQACPQQHCSLLLSILNKLGIFTRVVK